MPTKERYWRNVEILRERGRIDRRNYVKKYKEKINAKAKLWRKTKLPIAIYKKDKCCAKCGYKEHPEILHLHHLNPAEKNKKVSSRMYYMAKLDDEIKQEIAKCILLCPNCHYWLHYNGK